MVVSTASAQALMPPTRFFTFRNPTERRNSTAFELLPPILQCTTIWSDVFSSATRSGSSPRGIRMLPSMREICDLLGIPDVEDHQVIARAHPLVQGLRGDLPFASQVLLLDLFAADSAEQLVVDELRDCRMRAADGAVGVLAQLQLAEVHLHCVQDEEPSRQRCAFAQDAA